jgi:hypothetical protein
MDTGLTKDQVLTNLKTAGYEIPDSLSVDQIQPITPYKLPEGNYTQTTGNLSLANNATSSSILADSTYEPPENEDKNEAVSGLKGLLSKITGQASEASAINKAEQVAQKKQKAVSISNELDQLDKSFRDEVASIKENTQGKETSAINSDVARAQDRYENRRANISLAYKVALGDYQGAQEIANEKINALKDQNAQALQVYQALISSINDDLTEKEKLQVQYQYDLKRDKNKSVEDAYSQALMAGNDNGAGAGYFNAIDSAREKGDIAGIMSTISQYGYKTLEMQTQEAKLRTEEATLRKINADINDIDSSVIDNQISPYQEERQTRILQSVDELRKRVSGGTVGFASLGSFLPASLPRNFKTDLNTLKASIAFGELTAMREASKTGGALGQVSNIELNLLESALAGLDQGQSPANFRKNLDKVEGSIKRWQAAANKLGAPQTTAYTPGTVINYNGKSYRVGSDGDTLEEI